MDLSHSVSSGRLLHVAPLLPDHISHPADVNPSIMTVMTQHVPSDGNRVRLWVKYSLFGFNVVLWVRIFEVFHNVWNKCDISRKYQKVGIKYQKG